MEVFHEEREIRSKTPEGKVFITYEDSYTERFDDMKCPFCKNDLKFETGKYEMARNIYTESYKISCEFGCCLNFFGIKGNYEFKDSTDFVMHIRNNVLKLT